MAFIDEVAVEITATSLFLRIYGYEVWNLEDIEYIESAIKHLRHEMVKTYEKIGDLGDESVIALSQQLDVYLLKYQQHFLTTAKEDFKVRQRRQSPDLANSPA